MKQKTLITLFSLMIVVIAGMLVTIIVLASQTHNLNSNISISYTATEISGGVSATYQVGDGEVKNMVINGNTSEKTASFYGEDVAKTQNLSPTESQIVLLAGQELVFTYNFTNSGTHPYYATLRYDDTDGDDTNIKFEYKGPEDSTFSEDNSTTFLVPKQVNNVDGEATFQVKLSIGNPAFDSMLSGVFIWGLSMDNPNAIQNMDWGEIAKLSDKISTKGLTADQVYALYGWNIGDEKTFTMNNDTQDEVTVVILDFNHDDKSDGTGKAGITFGMKNLLGTGTYTVISSISDSGGWNLSLMRTSTMPTIFNNLPNDLSSVIKTVNKKASAGGESAQITTSQDQLFLLSMSEIYSASAITNTTDSYVKNYATTLNQEGTQYAYYNSLIGDGDPGSSWSQLIKKKLNSSGDAGDYWLRTTNYIKLENVCRYINISGYATFDSYVDWGLSFAFAI